MGNRCVDVEQQFRSGDLHRYAAVGERCDFVERKRVLAEDHLIAGTYIGVGEQRQNLIRAVTADNAISRKSEMRGDRLTQDLRGALRVHSEQLARIFIRRNRGRARAKRRFVRRQFVNACRTGRLRPAGHVNVDIQNAGFGSKRHPRSRLIQSQNRVGKAADGGHPTDHVTRGFRKRG